LLLEPRSIILSQRNQLKINTLNRKFFTTASNSPLTLKKIQMPSVDANVFIATAAAMLGQHINSCSRVIHTRADFQNAILFSTQHTKIAGHSGVGNTSTPTATVNRKLPGSPSMLQNRK